jgi:hypothetical protein
MSDHIPDDLSIPPILRRAPAGDDKAVPEISVLAYEKIDRWRDKLDQTPKLNKYYVFECAAADLFLEAAYERNLGAVQAITDAIYVLGRDHAGLDDDNIQDIMDSAKAKAERPINDRAAAQSTDEEPPPPTSEADYGFAGGQQQESRAEAHGKFESLPLVFYRDLKEARRKDWNIKNVMACGEVSSWFGPPGSGKSAILTDIAIAGASNQQWRGYRIKESFASIYFALERADLVKRRMIAHRLRDELPDDLPIAISGGVVGVMNRSCVDLIVDAIKRAEDQLSRRVGLGIFDTWGKAIAAGGGDEQQAKDQNIALANMRRVLDKVSIHIATVGHTGKDESRGERGSNAKQGDIDLEVQISGEATIKSAVVTKANDQPLGPLTSFQLEPFDFGPDEDGDPFRTYIVAQQIISGIATKMHLSGKQQLGVDALAEAILKHGVELPASYRMPGGLRSVTADQWQAELYRLGALDRKAKNPASRFSELRQALQVKRVIGVSDELVWLAAPATK